MHHHHRLTLWLMIMGLVVGLQPGAQAQSPEKLVFALHVTISPSWFDLRPQPKSPFGISMRSWRRRPSFAGERMAQHSRPPGPKPGRRVYGHQQGLRTTTVILYAEMSSIALRAKGTGAKGYRQKSPRSRWWMLTVRFHLREPWPDFMTFYGTTATAAGIVVPKKYMEQVGVDGFQKAPIGLGPYKFVSYTPGGDLVLEAYDGYWRKVPNIKRLILKGVPEGTTRLAMLKTGEADVAFALEGQVAEEVQRNPNFTLVYTLHASGFWLEFPEQWDPKSVWADGACAWR